MALLIALAVIATFASLGTGLLLQWASPPGWVSVNRSRVWTLATLLAVIAAVATAIAVVIEAESDNDDKELTAPTRSPDITEERSCGTIGENERATAGWGPNRPAHTMDHPAARASLNSIIDNPNYGDERVFFDVKRPEHHEIGGFCSSLRVEDGEVLLLRAYVENSASDHLRGTPQGTAKDVTLTIRPDERSASLRTIRAEVISSTTDPSMIFSVVEVAAERPFRLEPVVGSAMAYTNAHPTGVALPDAVWLRGTQLGFEELDGVIEPGYRYDVIATIEVVVVFENP